MVSINRLGGLTLPVESASSILTTAMRLLNSGMAKPDTRILNIPAPGRVDWAKIDPYDKIDLDVNRINNSSAKEQKFHRLHAA